MGSVNVENGAVVNAETLDNSRKRKHEDLIMPYTGETPDSSQSASTSKPTTVPEKRKAGRPRRKPLEAQSVENPTTSVFKIPTTRPRRGRPTRPTFDEVNTSKSKPSAKNEEIAWDEESITRMFTTITTQGFDGNFGELTKTFVGHSDNSLRYFFNLLAAKNKEKIEECSIATNSHKFIELAREVDAQCLGVNVPLCVEMLAILDPLPDPSTAGDVDYAALYRCMASLMRGEIPKWLNASSAAKLKSMLHLMDENFKRKFSRLPPPDSYQLPAKKVARSQQEKNAILERRRCIAWSREEEEAKCDVLSPDLAPTRKRYLRNDCFNPFKFPPE